MGLDVRPLAPEQRAWAAARLAQAWGSTVIISRGRRHDTARLDALVCLDAGEGVGLATLDVRNETCELVTLDAFHAGRGVGSALLHAVIAHARSHGCRRLWLITTNDNLRALRFYQRRGLRLVAVHPGAVDAARALKPSIPTIGEHGIPIHDELELELEL